MTRTRSIGREIGTALAVLGLYLLTILAPLHQARASQLELDALGFSNLATGWVICSAAAQDDQGQPGTIAKCPAAGIGKTSPLDPDLGVITLPVAVSLWAPLGQSFAQFAPAIAGSPNGPRAPPEAV